MRTELIQPAPPVVGYAPDPDSDQRPRQHACCVACRTIYELSSAEERRLAERWEPLCAACAAAYLPVLAAFCAAWLDLRRRLPPVVEVGS